MTERKWHALYTRFGKEMKVAASLAKKKIACYVPLYEYETLVNGRKRTIAGPLFPRFVFISLNEDEKEHIRRKSGDIINFMYWHDKPVEIHNDEINAMKKFLNEYSCTKVEKAAVLPGERYRFNDELQLVRNGNTVEVNVATVKLVLPSLGHVLVAEIRKEKAEEFALAKDLMVGHIIHS